MKRTLGLFRLGAIIGIVSLFAPHGRAETALTTLVTFDRTNGCIPEAGLVQGKDGDFYGTLGYGGWYDLGVVYRMTPNGKCIILVTFDGENGSHPDGLIQGKDGNFYGTTLQGGPDGSGSIFKMAPDGTITVLATFGYDNGYGPWGLVQGRDGNLYGKMSQFRGQSTFEVTLGGKLIIPATNGMPADSGGLLKAKDGNSYGTTFSGKGDNSNGFGLGTVFRIGPDGARTNLIVFNGTNGANPLSDLMQGRDGNIYGITTRGGVFNQGTIFRVNLAKTSSPVPTNINVPILIHPPANKINLLMSALGNNGTVTTETNVILDSNNANPYLDEFIFLPGGFRQMAATISATNEIFRLSLRYIGAVQAGHRPPKLPKGVTIADVSNVNYMVSVWSMTTPPRPINFYGKVVDENSNPVANAYVSFHWMETPTENGSRSSNIESDAEGLFSLRGATGPSLTVSVNKDGYYTSRSTPDSYHFDGNESFRPDSLNPIVFHLKKKGEGEELITSQNGIRPDVWVRVPKDGTPIRVDFFQKKASATGQLEISQNKPPFQGATNWSFSLSIPDGGLVANQDEFQFQAPDMGYQPTVGYNFEKGETNWTTQVSKQFYITFGQPRIYGWLRIESNLAQETIFLTYVINPTGSRNLEPQ